jgi:predicted transcriptional regulator
MDQPVDDDANRYISLHEYHRALIEEGIRQDDAGEMVEHETLMSLATGWIKRRNAD